MSTITRVDGNNFVAQSCESARERVGWPHAALRDTVETVAWDGTSITTHVPKEGEELAPRERFALAVRHAPITAERAKLAADALDALPRGERRAALDELYRTEPRAFAQLMAQFAVGEGRKESFEIMDEALRRNFVNGSFGQDAAATRVRDEILGLEGAGGTMVKWSLGHAIELNQAAWRQAGARQDHSGLTLQARAVERSIDDPTWGRFVSLRRRHPYECAAELARLAAQDPAAYAGALAIVQTEGLDRRFVDAVAAARGPGSVQLKADTARAAYEKMYDRTYQFEYRAENVREEREHAAYFVALLADKQLASHLMAEDRDFFHRGLTRLMKLDRGAAGDALHALVTGYTRDVVAALERGDREAAEDTAKQLGKVIGEAERARHAARAPATLVRLTLKGVAAFYPPADVVLDAYLDGKDERSKTDAERASGGLKRVAGALYDGLQDPDRRRRDLDENDDRHIEYYRARERFLGWVGEGYRDGLTDD